MTQYLFPHNLKAKAHIWLWSLTDFAIIGVAALLSVVTLVYLQLLLPAVATICFAFLTIQLDEATLGFKKYIASSESDVPSRQILAASVAV